MIGDNRLFTRVRRETGKEWVVQVHRDEGVAVRQAKLAGSSR